MAKTIRELREAHEMTQLALAYALNVTPLTISNWERGVHTPKVQQLRKLASIFGVTSDDILLPGDEESKEGKAAA